MGIAILFILCVIGAASSKDLPNEKKDFPVLRGVNMSGTEYSCMKSTGIFEGPVDDVTIANMKKWEVEIVRVPLNEGCWSNSHVPKAEHAGENYKKAIQDWVTRLREADLYVILELHWTEGLYSGKDQSKDLTGNGLCYDEGAVCQKPMPHLRTSVAFWKEVAEVFKGDQGIIFDLFNEPYPERPIEDLDRAWKCWKSGGAACKPEIEFDVAGMQDLVNAVREAGAKNWIMLGGLSYSNDLEKWLEHVPDDSENKLIASMHNYNFNACTDQACWDRGIGKIVDTHVVIVGEIGENDCKHDYIDTLMPYLDKKGIGYLGWTWNNWGCEDGPALIKDYDGEPTDYGVGFRDHLVDLANQRRKT